MCAWVESLVFQKNVLVTPGVQHRTKTLGAPGAENAHGTRIPTQRREETQQSWPGPVVPSPTQTLPEHAGDRNFVRTRGNAAHHWGSRCLRAAVGQTDRTVPGRSVTGLVTRDRSNCPRGALLPEGLGRRCDTVAAAPEGSR